MIERGSDEGGIPNLGLPRAIDLHLLPHLGSDDDGYRAWLCGRIVVRSTGVVTGKVEQTHEHITKRANFQNPLPKKTGELSNSSLLRFRTAGINAIDQTFGVNERSVCDARGNSSRDPCHRGDAFFLKTQKGQMVGGFFFPPPPPGKGLRVPVQAENRSATKSAITLKSCEENVYEQTITYKRTN